MALLERLKSRGVRCAIVSNKPDAAARELGERWFGGLVATTVGDREGIRRKPAPDTLLEVMRQLGAAPERTVYIGDSEVDIETAKAARRGLHLRNLGLPHARAAYRLRSIFARRRRGRAGKRAVKT